MMELIKRNYWWLGIKNDIKNIYSRMLQILAKQGAIYKESWRTTSLENTRKTMARDQY